MGVFFLYSIPVAIYLRVSCANAPSMNKQHFHVRLCLCFYLFKCFYVHFLFIGNVSKLLITDTENALYDDFMR